MLENIAMKVNLVTMLCKLMLTFYEIATFRAIFQILHDSLQNISFSIKGLYRSSMMPVGNI